MRQRNRRARRLIYEAAEWRVLGLLFDVPKNSWFKEVTSLGREVKDRNLRRAALAAQMEATEGLFHTIFGPGGPVPGREISYRGCAEPGLVISEIRAYYSAFYFNPLTEEPLDHISVEAAFISYLKLKHAFALFNNDDEAARVTQTALETFIVEHLSQYAETFSRLLFESGIKYLDFAARSLRNHIGPIRHKSKENTNDLVGYEAFNACEFKCGSL
jgi:nitrate reductase assembly molybdenum cofactor insertion protein NarJ